MFFFVREIVRLRVLVFYIREDTKGDLSGI